MVIKEEKKNQTERKKPHQCDIRASNDAENVCSHYGNPTKEDFVTFQPQTTQKRFVYIVFLAWRLHDVILYLTSNQATRRYEDKLVQQCIREQDQHRRPHTPHRNDPVGSREIPARKSAYRAHWLIRKKENTW